MGESGAEQQDQDMTEEERSVLIKKADNFLSEKQKEKAEEGVKAQQAIEDLTIARHIGETGREFPTREQNLKDALDWNAKEATQKQQKVEGAIRDAIAYGDKKRAEEQIKSGNLVTTNQAPRPNLPQRLIGLINGIIGRK